MTEDLITWLRQQLDEEERDARVVEGNGEWDCPSTGVLQLGGVADLDGLVLAPRGVVYHIINYSPARVLREVEAKRRLLDWLDVVDRFLDQEPMDYYRLGGQADTDEARWLLASIYSDRPGFRQEWAPDATS